MKRNPIMMYRKVIICFFLVFAYGCSDSNNDDGFGLLPAVPEPTPIQPANAGQPGWLYVQTAATAKMTSDTVLEIPFTRDVFGFTDRPDRKQAYLTAFEFASLWTAEGANSFSADAPNAVLTWLVGEEQREAEVIIKNATVYADGAQESLVYEVTLEAGQMPDAQMSSVSLFVDSSGDAPASSVQVCSSKDECKTVSSQEEFSDQVNTMTDGNWYVSVDGQIGIKLTPGSDACVLTLVGMSDWSVGILQEFTTFGCRR
jgi:hypothetical protein